MKTRSSGQSCFVTVAFPAIDTSDTPSPVYKYRTSGMQYQLHQYSLQRCNKQNEIEQHLSLQHLVCRTLRINGDSEMTCGYMQAQYERHAAQAAVAQTAKVQLRKETEWMRRQPKARSTKSKSRQDAFYELSDVARSGPKKDAKADFGAGGMSRQVSHCLVQMHISYYRNRQLCLSNRLQCVIASLIALNVVGTASSSSMKASIIIIIITLSSS